MRIASWAGTCTALMILASLGPNTSPESLSIYSVRDLRTFNMTWKQGFKTNSLPFLSLPALQCGKLMKWRARQNGMYVVWAQPKGPALLKGSIPGDEGAGRVVSLKAVRPSLTSRQIGSDHSFTPVWRHWAALSMLPTILPGWILSWYLGCQDALLTWGQRLCP